MTTHRLLNNNYLLPIACALYFGFELFYNAHIKLCVDDFWFAHVIYQYKSSIPYRDFAPYKMVLGYYLLLPTMTMAKGLFAPLYLTKNLIAVINTLMIFAAGHLLQRYYKKSAVYTAVLLIMFSEIFLSYSTNIRVDLLAYWCCFISVILLFEEKLFFSGLTLGLGFIISQKVLWYFIASNFTLGIFLLYYLDKKYLYKLIKFNAGTALILSAYIAIWSLISDFYTVIHSVFYEAYVMYGLDSYASARKFLWQAILSNNPLLFFLWPVTGISLLLGPLQDPRYQKRVFVLIYASVLYAALIVYKQPFPYYMLTLVPANLLLYSAFFAWLDDIYHSKVLFYRGSTRLIWFLGIAYTVGLCYLLIKFNLQKIYLSIAFVPLLIAGHLSSTPLRTGRIAITLNGLLLLFVGIVYPFVLYSLQLLDNSNQYQQDNLKLVSALLQSDDDYLAGIELFYNKKQPIQSLRHLDYPGLLYLAKQEPKLSKAMLSSLYHTPQASVSQALTALKAAKIKLFINNYRMEALPLALKKYLYKHYQHYWGSIYLYSPLYKGLHTHIDLKFAGKYLLESDSPIVFDNIIWLPLTAKIVSQGAHSVHAEAHPYRLRFIPQNMHLESMQADQWEKII